MSCALSALFGYLKVFQMHDILSKVKEGMSGEETGSGV